MSTKRKVLLTVLAGLMLLVVLFSFNLIPTSGEQAARQKLNNLLGQGSDELPELEPDQPQSAPEEPGSLPGVNGGSFFGMPMPLSGAGVDVQELADKYVLRIPLADSKDASSVKLNVEPHRIEVSGQTGAKQNGASVSSSFLQSFTTSQEVLPDHISRRTEQDGETTELVITIPKKHPDQSGSTAPELDNPNRDNTQPDTQDEAPLPNAAPNPLDGVENKVI